MFDNGALDLLKHGHQPGLQSNQLDLQLQDEHGLEPRGKRMSGYVKYVLICKYVLWAVLSQLY